MTISSYLVFNGQAEEAAKFYAEALGGTIVSLHRYSEMPPDACMPEIPENLKSRVMHSQIDFPGGYLALADSLPDDPRAFGNGHVLTLNGESVEQTEAAWARLTAGAQKIPCPLGEVFYAKRYGEIVDRFGVLWAVMFEEV